MIEQISAATTITSASKYLDILDLAMASRAAGQGDSGGGPGFAGMGGAIRCPQRTGDAAAGRARIGG